MNKCLSTSLPEHHDQSANKRGAKVLVPGKYIEETIDKNVSKPWQTSQVEEPATSILIHEVGEQSSDLIECPTVSAKYEDFCFI